MRISKHGEDGSALMLVPAGVFILLLLGALTVDSAIAFSAQRELTNSATAAVNDAITQSISDEQLQQGADAKIDAGLAERIVRSRIAANDYNGLRVAPENIRVGVDQDSGTITVVAEGDSPYIFSKAIPGRANSARVRVMSSAQLHHRSAD